MMGTLKTEPARDLSKPYVFPLGVGYWAPRRNTRLTVDLFKEISRKELPHSLEKMRGEAVHFSNSQYELQSQDCAPDGRAILALKLENRLPSASSFRA
jgi:hypothetical protein